MISEKHTWVFYTVEDVASGIQVRKGSINEVQESMNCHLGISDRACATCALSCHK